jgi:hypothetical protein
VPCQKPGILPFTLKGSPEPRMLSGLNFSREMCLPKNREIFDILNNHNMLSARWLQNRAKISIYNKTENPWVAGV